MGIQFKQGVLELCILSILSKRDYFGYELVSTLSSQFKLKESAIYPLLRRMVNEGYIESYMSEDTSDTLSRKYYKLTEIGLSTKTKLNYEWDDLTHRVKQLIKED